MGKRQSKNQVSKKTTTNHTVFGLFLILLALITLGGIVGGAGFVGQLISQGTYYLLGAGSVLIPITLATSGVLLICKKNFSVTLREGISAGVGIFSLLTLLALLDRGSTPSFGGITGGFLARGVIGSFDIVFGSIVVVFLTTVSFMIFFDRTPNPFPFFTGLWSYITGLFSKRVESADDGFDADEAPYQAPQLPMDATVAVADQKQSQMTVTDASANTDFVIDTKKKKVYGAYTPPPLNLLEGDRGKANVGDVKANANVIRRTLMNFGIEVEMDEVTIGPTVTRYALKPAQGVKLSRIVGLQNDLALSLAAHPLRIEAPIPGKSLVGIEIPNRTKATVGLATLIADPAFANNPKPLIVALGRNISGKSVLQSIAKMPHLLIAGTTGSGKSVTIHAIITSLLYRHGPDDLRVIFVDPKRVELTLYNGIPHLLTPVITEPKKAILSLKWAATEMNRRYDILESESVRDIESYHQKYAQKKVNPENEEDRMPFIVIIIDELADIMQAYPRELESAIVRLAQMSRAVGIHLILSTQRPEVNIITGLIKANVPARIALRVPTQIDSRTILDAAGAEKLLGMGDMLAMIGSSQAERIQSAYITEEEVKEVVKYLKGAFKDDIRETIELSGTVAGDKPMFSNDMEDGEDEDALYEEARAIIIEAGKGSTSYIQRKLKVGYARAARLMDMLEQRGVIGRADGAKPREVLVDKLKKPVSDTVAEEMGL